MFGVPAPLKVEHQELDRELARAIRQGGRVGIAAKRVADLLRAQFARDEDWTLLPLGALPELVAGKSISDAVRLVELAKRLREELPAMTSEYGTILAAIDELQEAAAGSADSEVARTAGMLKRHAHIKTNVLYPAALLVGEFLKRQEAVATTPARWPEVRTD
jgi:hypothetical protein